MSIDKIKQDLLAEAILAETDYKKNRNLGQRDRAARIRRIVSNLDSLGGGSSGVTSFNTRTGAVTLTSSDVTTALGYTPLSSVPTLDQVTTAGNTTSNAINTGGLVLNSTDVVISGNSSNIKAGRLVGASNDVLTVWQNQNGGSPLVVKSYINSLLFNFNGDGAGVFAAYITTRGAYTVPGIGFSTRSSGANYPAVNIYANSSQTANLLEFKDSLGNILSAFTSSASLLIGTTTDAGYKLDVNGTLRTQVSLSGIPNIIHVSNLQTDGGPGGAIAFYTGGVVGNASRITAQRSGPVGQSDIALETNGLTRLFVSTTGNVGIGTSSPSQKLTVNGITYSANGFKTDNGFSIGALGYNSAVRFNNDNIDFNGSAGGSVARIVGASGNVLIGTTTDAGYKLDVNGTARVSGDLSAVNGLITFSNPGGNRTMTTSGLTINYGSTYSFSVTGTNTASITPTADLTLKGIYHTQVSTDVYRIQKLTNVGHLQINFDIVGSDATAHNYGTRSGNVRIYPGAETNGNGYGNVILGHDGTNSRGNVGIGTSSPAGPLHVKYSSSTLAGITIENDGVGFNAGSMTLRSGTTGGTNMSVTVGGGMYWFNLDTSSNTLSLPSTGNLIVGGAVDAGYRLDVQGGDARFAQNVEAASYSVAGNAGYSGIVNFPGNPPGSQNLEFLHGILINVF